MKFIRISLATIATAAVFVVASPHAFAAPPPGPFKDFFPDTNGYFIHPNCLSSEQGVADTSGKVAVPCGIREVAITATNVTRFLLAIVGSVTLLVFVYGGFLWVTSAGNADQVKKGRQVFLGALVGLAVIFSSAIIINITVASLSGQDLGDTIKIFDQPTLQIPGG